ncbi:hypothetical protein AGR2A_pa60135 [Agrobacterium genomosp. 2 str. CFBP 5494]|uniref:Uncharacterized protein n=1 Tax=Agrobacterium genomosp. 2 str. CFBP 5494 TaxID=1183436 RepID=A0A9W5F2Y1_9HYPH|nr:hypothetical protein [Agrobacterium pusense]MDH2196434.1 hypothetical protein [Agrobacterium pusense]CUX02802.1 hypothetical protein AGR2A_pa60135 [Agrobacterium genomosp. 2 str. CFBP 5494]
MVVEEGGDAFPLAKQYLDLRSRRDVVIISPEFHGNVSGIGGQVGFPIDFGDQPLVEIIVNGLPHAEELTILQKSLWIDTMILENVRVDMHLPSPLSEQFSGFSLLINWHPSGDGRQL